MPRSVNGCFIIFRARPWVTMSTWCKIIRLNVGATCISCLPCTWCSCWWCLRLGCLCWVRMFYAGVGGGGVGVRVVICCWYSRFELLFLGLLFFLFDLLVLFFFCGFGIRVVFVSRARFFSRVISWVASQRSGASRSAHRERM